jgi:hypothetical protein
MKSHFDQLDAIAFQLIAALEQYEEDVGVLVRKWHVDQDMERYALVSRKVDEIRNLCGAMPSVAAQWVTVLISHTELMHGLLRPTRPASNAMLLEEQLLDHQAVVEALRSKCRRMLLSSNNRRPS